MVWRGIEKKIKKILEAPNLRVAQNVTIMPLTNVGQESRLKTVPVLMSVLSVSTHAVQAAHNRPWDATADFEFLNGSPV